MFRIIGRLTSIINTGCTMLVLFIFAFGAYSVYLIKSGEGVGSVLGTTDRPLITADPNAGKNLSEKIKTFNSSLEENGSADLVLSENEATLFLNTYLSELQDYYFNVFDNFLVDIESGRAYVYADGPGGTDFKMQFVSNVEESILIETDEIYIGKVRIPGIVREKINSGIYQGVEQLKTSNFGGMKIMRLKFMEDMVAIELEKV